MPGLGLLLTAAAAAAVTGLSSPITTGASGSGRSATPVRPAVSMTAVAPRLVLTAVTYQLPVSGPLVVLRPFAPPPTPYAAGHRGVDLAAPAGGVVLAAGSGQVSFAGSVAGRGVVVVVHPDGVRTEYEPVTPLVAAGRSVMAGQPIGRVHGRHGSCPPDACLHWGARRQDVYFDPLSLLRALGPVRLLPWA